jgi:multiple sugar transport system permease protein
MSLIVLFPFVWVVLSSFKTQLEIFQIPPTILPAKPTLSNYADALDLLPPGQQPTSEIPAGLRNSLEVALPTTILMLLIACPAGYAFARVRFPARRPLLILMLTLQMIPGLVLVVPLFALAVKVHLFDTKLALGAVYVAFNLPLGVWLLSVFFQEVPQDLDDAARIDGCTRIGALYHVYLPLSLPAVATVGILVFSAVWNEFLFAVMLTETVAAKTAPVAIAQMQSPYETRWAIMTAGAVAFSLPALFIAYFAQRYIVKGLTLGAVKG